MKTDEELGHDRRVEFETDDEENEAETVADSDDVDDDDDTECSKTSSSNKSDQSDDGLGNYVSSWPQSYRLGFPHLLPFLILLHSSFIFFFF